MISAQLRGYSHVFLGVGTWSDESISLSLVNELNQLWPSACPVLGPRAGSYLGIPNFGPYCLDEDSDHVELLDCSQESVDIMAA